MLNAIEKLGNCCLKQIQSIGKATLLLAHILCCPPRLKRMIPMIVNEIYTLGVLSLLIITVSAFFVGMVIGLQGYHTLEKFSSTAQLGQVLALTITRELGPVLTALLFTGRACSALTAEIGLMKSTEQLESMEMMGVDPIWRIIAPRFWAGFISLPLLTMLFDGIAILGGYWVGVIWFGIDPGLFWNNMNSTVSFKLDVMSGIYKSLMFAVLVVWVSLYQGLSAKPSAAGVSLVTTRTVVYGSLLILGFDFILTAYMIGDW